MARILSLVAIGLFFYCALLSCEKEDKSPRRTMTCSINGNTYAGRVTASKYIDNKNGVIFRNSYSLRSQFDLGLVKEVADSARSKGTLSGPQVRAMLSMEANDPQQPRRLYRLISDEITIREEMISEAPMQPATVGIEPNPSLSDGLQAEDTGNEQLINIEGSFRLTMVTERKPRDTIRVRKGSFEAHAIKVLQRTY